MPQRSSSREAGRRRQPARHTRPSGTAFDAALRLLGRRAHSRVELERKLRRRGFDDSAVAATVARLIAHGYIDDRAFAAGHIRRRSSGRGPLALAAELAARGVARDVVAEAVSGLEVEAQLESATRLAERMCASRSWPGYHEMLDAIGAKLVRRGFSLAVARAACRAAWTGTTAETEA